MFSIRRTVVLVFRPISGIEVIELYTDGDDGQGGASPETRLRKDEEPDECQFQRPPDEVSYSSVLVAGEVVFHASKLTLCFGGPYFLIIR